MSGDDLDLASLHSQGHSLFGPDFQTILDGQANSGQRSLLRFPLAYAPRNCWAFGDPDAVLILRQGYKKPHALKPPYFFVCPRAKMLATKVSTSVALSSLYP